MNAAHHFTEQRDSLLPSTIPAYLDQLRVALAGADPALVQDALYDAEEYLRSELADNPGRSEAEVIASVAGSYGAPAEVAEIYRETEVRVQTALRPPAAPPRRSWVGRFFGVATEPRTYAALLYMLLALATGIFYFTWVITGISLSLGLAVLIVGVPFVILYFGSVRVLSLVEGRLVEAMLGERMPRRPLYAARGRPWLQRIGDMFADPRTWSAQLYFVLMLPLGILYFTLIATLLAFSIGCIAAPIATAFGAPNWVTLGDLVVGAGSPWTWPLWMAVGILALLATLHLARGIGHLHAQLAKHLLVKSAQYS